LILPAIDRKLISERVENYILLPKVGNWDSWRDHSCLNGPIPLYGSTANINNSKLELDKIYPVLTEKDIENPEAIDFPNPADIVRPDAHLDVGRFFPQGYFVTGEGSKYNNLYWLPLFLSVGFFDRVSQPHKGMNTTVAKDYKNDSGSSSSAIHTGKFEPTQIEMAEQFIAMIMKNLDLYKGDSYWKDVGRALYTVGQKVNDPNRALHIWINYTDQVRKHFNYEYDEWHQSEECEELFPTFDDDVIPLTIETLGFYARRAAPDDYRIWHNQWCEASIREAVSATHEDVAEALRREYWLDYKCASLDKGGVWYQYREPRWVKIEKGVYLRTELAENFVKKFEHARHNISSKIIAMSGTNNSDKKMKEAMMAEYANVIKKIKTDGYQNSVMNVAARKFYVENFNMLLNSNENFMGTKNYIIETIEDRAIIRPGKPEDYVGLSTGKKFNTDYTWDHPDVQAVLKWYRQMFPDRELMHEVLKWQSSTIRGRNSNKKAVVLTGDGDNSKSMFKKGNEAAFGDYSIPAPKTLLTATQGKSGPTPEIARSAGRHQLWVSEPNEKQEFSGAEIKELTGGDKMFVRMLNENGGDMELFFHLIIQCNDIPPITSGGAAAQRRIYIIPFLSKWVENAPEDEAEQFATRTFPMDLHFEDVLKAKLGPAILWVLVQYYPIYLREKLRTPAIVKEVTDAYWRENDKYCRFINDQVEDATLPDGTPDTTKFITVQDLYKEFRLWYNDNYSDNMPPSKPIFEKEMQAKNRLGKLDGNLWRGKRQNAKGISADFKKHAKGPTVMTGNVVPPIPMTMGTRPGVPVSVPLAVN
jgi:phage/plasmid-associated DNA primase